MNNGRSPHPKRLFDIFLSTLALLLLSPLLALLALLVRFKLGTPILFRQQRPGLHGRPFTLIKFRTMTDARDDAQDKLLPAPTDFLVLVVSCAALTWAHESMLIFEEGFSFLLL